MNVDIGERRGSAQVCRLCKTIDGAPLQRHSRRCHARLVEQLAAYVVILGVERPDRVGPSSYEVESQGNQRISCLNSLKGMKNDMSQLDRRDRHVPPNEDVVSWYVAMKKRKRGSVYRSCGLFAGAQPGDRLRVRARTAFPRDPGRDSGA